MPCGGAALWALLARLVIEQPRPQWLDELEAQLAEAEPSGPLAPQLTLLLVALRKSRRHPGGATVLAVDRTRLLSMIVHGESLTVPCESAALGVPANGDRVLDVLRSYREAGFEPMAHARARPTTWATRCASSPISAGSSAEAHEAG
ncbi:MAG: hypothetical protein MZW92_00045 [Comamonadaceae bacterium]|nr:hypothetical protein [Comamonadaceae bacterium]